MSSEVVSRVPAWLTDSVIRLHKYEDEAFTSGIAARDAEEKLAQARERANAITALFNFLPEQPARGLTVVLGDIYTRLSAFENTPKT